MKESFVVYFNQQMAATKTIPWSELTCLAFSFLLTSNVRKKEENKNWKRLKMNKKGWKPLKKYFDQLSGACNTWKLAETHNTYAKCLLKMTNNKLLGNKWNMCVLQTWKCYIFILNYTFYHIYFKWLHK